MLTLFLKQIHNFWIKLNTPPSHLLCPGSQSNSYIINVLQNLEQREDCQLYIRCLCRVYFSTKKNVLNNLISVLWIENWWCWIVLEKDNKDLQCDNGAGGRTTIPEDEGAGSVQWCTQTWGSLPGHAEPGSLVNREWETMDCDMEWGILVSPQPRTLPINHSLSQSN